jgi:hypothetical protein
MGSERRRSPECAATGEMRRKRSFAGWHPPGCDISDPSPGPETQPFIEGVHTGISSAALHQHVVAVSRPCMFECSHDHGLAMASASQLRVSDHVLQKPMAPSAAKQIRCDDEHAGCCDPIAIVGYKNVDAGVRHSFMPDSFGMFSRLCDRAYLRRLEKGEE